MSDNMADNAETADRALSPGAEPQDPEQLPEESPPPQGELSSSLEALTRAAAERLQISNLTININVFFCIFFLFFSFLTVILSRSSPCWSGDMAFSRSEHFFCYGSSTPRP
jgi:hypothetical protein